MNTSSNWSTTRTAAPRRDVGQQHGGMGARESTQVGARRRPATRPRLPAPVTTCRTPMARRPRERRSAPAAPGTGDIGVAPEKRPRRRRCRSRTARVRARRRNASGSAVATLQPRGPAAGSPASSATSSDPGSRPSSLVRIERAGATSAALHPDARHRYWVSASNRPAPLTQGCLGHAGLRVRQRTACPPARRAASRRHSSALQAQFVQPSRLDSAGVPAGQVHKRRARSTGPAPPPWSYWARSASPTATNSRPRSSSSLEAPGVDPVSGNCQPVSVTRRLDRLGIQHPPQPQDAARDDLVPGRRGLFTPQRVRQAFGADCLTGDRWPAPPGPPDPAGTAPRNRRSPPSGPGGQSPGRPSPQCGPGTETGQRG